MDEKVCYILGDCKQNLSIDEIIELKVIIKNLIVNENVNNFIITINHHFESICQKLIFNLQKEYPNVKRILYRTKYYITHTQKMLYELFFDMSVYPQKLPFPPLNKRRASHIAIKNADICLFYFDNNSNGNKIITQVYKRIKKKNGKKVIVFGKKSCQ